MRKLGLLWLPLACAAALAACDGAPVGTDGGADAQTPDGGPDGGNVCSGRTLCATAGTSCDGDNLVTCATDGDGCLVSTRTDCAASGESCEAAGGAAACVDACAGIPAADRCDVDGARACDGATLEVCTMNVEGCLVLERTECDAAPGGACDASGEMPVCAIPADPCASIPAADRCTTAGRSCDGTALVQCAPNAFGCLVTQSTDCSERADGTCDASGGAAACTFTGDPCDGVVECGTPGARCDGPDLVECAADAFGCFVETRTECTDAPFGFCDADATPAAMCSTAATDPCMGLTECGAAASRTCTDESTLDVCAANAFGCFVSTSTSCAAASEVCSDASGTALCVDPCSLIATCPASTYCDGSDIVTCVADAQGCLIEDERSTCLGACELVDGAPECADTICPQAAPEVIDCASGTIMGNTADGANDRTGYVGCAAASYPGQERIYRFAHDGPTAVAVRIEATRLDGDDDFDLFAWSAGDGSTSCTETNVTCLGASLGVSATEVVNFVVQPGARSYIAYDRFGSGGTTNFTLEVTCTPVVCGDGVINGGEQCDDGNDVSGDGCSSTCTREPAHVCTGTPSVCEFTCGNGTVQSGAGENCDDGNTEPGDGCSPVCVREPGYTCTGAPSVCTFVCGNGIIQSAAGETCDDGNTMGGDGCSEVCAVEMGYSCFGAPSTCFLQAPNATCAGAEALTTSGVTGHDLRNGGPRPTGTSCGSTLGAVRYYSFDIPAGSFARVVATPTGSPAWDITLRTLEDCSGNCLSALNASSSTGVAETLALANTTSAPITRLVAVGANSSTNFNTYDLALAIEPLPANAECSMATPITADTTIPNQFAHLGGPRPSGTDCGGGTGATALYYAVTVPAGQRVRAQTTVPSGNDIVLFTVADCAATSCLSSTDSAPEQITIDNPSGAPLTRIIGIRQYNPGSGGAYSIAFTYSTLPYIPSAFSAACADVSAGTPVTGPTGDDTASAILELPLAFSYFGEAVTHYSVSSNGFMQLWPSASGSPSATTFTNAAMPNILAPNGVVAPFWDDLRPNIEMGVTSLVTGEAGSRRFVVQWTDWRASGSGTESLTFQAHLHEGTGVVEFHYCAMNAGATGALHTGSSATIGLENLAGTVATQHSFNQANAVMTGSGLRFTPNP